MLSPTIKVQQKGISHSVLTLVCYQRSCMRPEGTIKSANVTNFLFDKLFGPMLGEKVFNNVLHNATLRAIKVYRQK